VDDDKLLAHATLIGMFAMNVRSNRPLIAASHRWHLLDSSLCTAVFGARCDAIQVPPARLHTAPDRGYPSALKENDGRSCDHRAGLL